MASACRTLLQELLLEGARRTGCVLLFAAPLVLLGAEQRELALPLDDVHGVQRIGDFARHLRAHKGRRHHQMA